MAPTTKPSEVEARTSSLPREGSTHPHLSQDRLKLLERHRGLREGLMKAIVDENNVEIESLIKQGVSLLPHYYSSRSEARTTTPSSARSVSRYSSKGPKSGLVNPVDFAVLERKPAAAMLILQLGDGRTMFDRDEKQSFLNKVNIAQQTVLAVAQAAFHGYVDLLQALVDRRAHVGQKNVHGDSALLLAVRAGREHVANVLLERGAWQVEEKKRAVLQTATPFGMTSVLDWGRIQGSGSTKPQPWDRLVHDFAEAQTCDERQLRLDTLLEASRCWMPVPSSDRAATALPAAWRGPSPASLGGMSPTHKMMHQSRGLPSSQSPVRPGTAPAELAQEAFPGCSTRLHELQEQLRQMIDIREGKFQEREAHIAERAKLHSITIAQVGHEDEEIGKYQKEIDRLDADIEADNGEIARCKENIYNLEHGRLEDGSLAPGARATTTLGWSEANVACSADLQALNTVRKEFQQAIKRNQSTVYRALVRDGVLMNAKFDLGFGEMGNFIDWVVVKNYPNKALELLEYSSELGFATEYATEARAAFFWSVVQGYTMVLKALLSHGCDIGQRSKVWSSGDTALDLAVFGSRTAEVEELLRHGAWQCEPPERQQEILRWARSRPSVLQVLRNEGIVQDQPPVFAFQREAHLNPKEVQFDPPDVAVAA